MTAHDEFFTSEEVDEQIEFLSHMLAQHRATHARTAQAISQLHDFYMRNSEEHTRALERVWLRIVEQHQFAQQSSQKKGQQISMQSYPGGQQEQPAHYHHTSHKQRTFARPLSILAAVLFIAILVGSMAFVFNAARQNAATHQAQVKTNTHTGSDGKPHPKPPHPITGGKCTLDTTVTHVQQSASSVPGLYIFASNQQSDNLLYRYDTRTKQILWSKKLCNAFESNGTIEHNGVLYHLIHHKLSALQLHQVKAFAVTDHAEFQPAVVCDLRKAQDAGLL
jgi:hypothetical protein